MVSEGWRNMAYRGVRGRPVVGGAWYGISTGGALRQALGRGNRRARVNIGRSQLRGAYRAAEEAAGAPGAGSAPLS